MSEASCDASEADLDMKFEPAIKREIFENIHKEAAKVIASEVPDRVIPKDIVHSIVGVINSQNKTALHPKNNKPTRSTVKKANKIGELIYKYVEKFDNLNDPTKCTKQITIRMVRENETDQSQ
ncbi:hypothetical protein RF11_10416 [Thelohanellus kitauei]|uniref:Uncharacterized protein n=1 Tax=Thelohanellus kitauei TaxID=669202 RepID=A0A0C2JZP2_THEKT|nr:hypothetical protein RF11_10416 [Thelohanellus kitauei]